MEIKLRIRSVMGNLWCQLDGTCIQLKHKHLHRPMKDSLNQIIWIRKTHAKSGWHFLVATWIKQTCKRKLFILPVYLHSGRSVLLLHSFFDIRITLPQTPVETRTSGPQEPSRPSRPDGDFWDLWPHRLSNYWIFILSSVKEQLLDYQDYIL